MNRPSYSTKRYVQPKIGNFISDRVVYVGDTTIPNASNFRMKNPVVKKAYQLMCEHVV